MAAMVPPFPGEVRCPGCDGSGRRQKILGITAHTRICDACNGRGWVPEISGPKPTPPVPSSNTVIPKMSPPDPNWISAVSKSITGVSEQAFGDVRSNPACFMCEGIIGEKADKCRGCRGTRTMSVERFDELMKILDEALAYLELRKKEEDQARAERQTAPARRGTFDVWEDK